ncbi:hypothetical protein N7489_001405 [Penicillium chrysogenum]|uniref:Uncharacterized protein n=1 Tax=Penicillium chrysogenum TaxID=5076 RepID=A0ABQ8WJV0_PENCH|nr:uncharacterized protein N7489_001405 [Penicillium chrysogenum]KAJ5250995.1 hypothetical protein N7489_001405 [Penicillium chrysogenum]KAJ5262433.1 hypothetical protein N7524_007738 [Penicillium chrysogenum]KAJ5269895.1 hypothetical protein N7505_005653 [Penicillium chrysogenum]KAJ6147372.1 hypothetical protein N7497_009354 [Penicillium chrysogenum]
MYCRVNLQFGQVHIITRGHLNSGQRNIRVNVFVKYYRISLLSVFSQLPRQDFSTLILLSICSNPLDRLIFGIFNLRGGREIVAYPTFRLPLGSIAGPIRPQIQWLSDRCIPRNTLDSAIPSPDLRLG